MVGVSGSLDVASVWRMLMVSIAVILPGGCSSSFVLGWLTMNSLTLDRLLIPFGRLRSRWKRLLDGRLVVVSLGLRLRLLDIESRPEPEAIKDIFMEATIEEVHKLWVIL